MEEGDGSFHHRVPGLLGGVVPLQNQGMDGIRVKQTATSQVSMPTAYSVDNIASGEIELWPDTNK